MNSLSILIYESTSTVINRVKMPECREDSSRFMPSKRGLPENICLHWF